MITTIPCLADNYAYAVHAPAGAAAVVIDPGEAIPVIQALHAAKLQLGAILLTHHHWDHVGGVIELLGRWPGIPVLAHASDQHRIQGQNGTLVDGQELEILGLRVQVIHVPGHTLGALAYRFGDAVFTGDTLFCAGCGRLFEGTAPQMFHSLNARLGALPDLTQLYPGHEYTVRNLQFSAQVEPLNSAIADRQARALSLRNNGQPTVPSTLEEERATNPFLRAHRPELLPYFERTHRGVPARPEVAWAWLRQDRNRF